MNWEDLKLELPILILGSDRLPHPIALTMRSPPYLNHERSPFQPVLTGFNYEHEIYRARIRSGDRYL